ncbi:MAG: hypothetical protein KC503_37665 [Myxococcales bacterium]|nr:hypothetical protein [Myxococcales bacterium]
MKNKIVEVRELRSLVNRSPGFAKKELSDYKLDIVALCGFGCLYCSSNHGNFLRINREPFADLTEAQLGQRLLPADDPSLMFTWRDVVRQLETELRRKRAGFGSGKTLVFSMLTDGFSPKLVADGTTRAVLDLILEHTEFRIRILTKNAIVGSARWIQYFSNHADRFVVGLSTGTLDDRWAKRIEIGTSSPTARLRALHRLQDAGVATYGMLCPVFPDVLVDDGVERLVDAIKPDLVEHIWAEPFNDRVNWRVVRKGYDLGSPMYGWLTDVYERRNIDRWSAYATELYQRLREKAEVGGWMHKLRYLLYEQHISGRDAPMFEGLAGVLLQSKPDEHGHSKNPYMTNLQPR